MAWAPDYATASELKAYLRIDDAVDDTQVALAVAAASRAIDNASNRQFGQVAAPEARYYPPRWDNRRGWWTVPIDDLMTATGLVVDVDLDGDLTYGHAVTDHQLAPLNAPAESRPWETLLIRPSSAVQPTDPLVDQVRVTARYGWSSIPTPVTQACLLQASRVISRRDAPFGVAGSPDAGSEMRLLAKVDPDVAVILRSYRRVWGAA